MSKLVGLLLLLIVVIAITRIVLSSYSDVAIRDGVEEWSYDVASGIDSEVSEYFAGVYLLPKRYPYGSDEAIKELRKLREVLRPNYVALVVYLHQYDRYSCTVEIDESQDLGLRKMVEVAHNLGLKVMLVLFLLVDDGTWRGFIKPSDVEEWFRSYKRAVLHYAKLAQELGVEVLCIGSELESLKSRKYASYWVDIIDSVRSVYSGLITYNTNWWYSEWGFRELLDLEWFRYLDFIGVSAYFELSRTEVKSVSELVECWYHTVHGRNVMSDLEKLARRYGKPIVLTEVGYRSVKGAEIKPWKFSDSGKPDPEKQAMCFEALFRAFLGNPRPWFRGVFVWGWTTDPSTGTPSDTSYDLKGKPASDVVRKWFMRIVPKEVQTVYTNFTTYLRFTCCRLNMEPLTSETSDVVLEVGERIIKPIEVRGSVVVFHIPDISSAKYVRFISGDFSWTFNVLRVKHYFRCHVDRTTLRVKVDVNIPRGYAVANICGKVVRFYEYFTATCSLRPGVNKVELLKVVIPGVAVLEGPLRYTYILRYSIDISARKYLINTTMTRVVISITKTGNVTVPFINLRVLVGERVILERILSGELDRPYVEKLSEITIVENKSTVPITAELLTDSLLLRRVTIPIYIGKYIVKIRSDVRNFRVYVIKSGEVVYETGVAGNHLTLLMPFGNYTLVFLKRGYATYRVNVSIPGTEHIYVNFTKVTTSTKLSTQPVVSVKRFENNLIIRLVNSTTNSIEALVVMKLLHGNTTYKTVLKEVTLPLGKDVIIPIPRIPIESYTVEVRVVDQSSGALLAKATYLVGMKKVSVFERLLEYKAMIILITLISVIVFTAVILYRRVKATMQKLIKDLISLT
ncbi:MAG: hypothetical protein DRJ40_06690 [Thermoprotei archaeon]|nr:MAG: hypothetical protein DRJ40_06690 [Thermoprotei archaeon]